MIATSDAHYGALCSGIGGLELAVEEVFGYEPAWHSEVDADAVLTHDRHWPLLPNLGDLTAVDWAEVEPVELICAGYPCQPFSHAGARRGEEDDRHLWPHVAEAVRVLRPRWVVLENVAGHLSLGFGAVVGALAEAGYDAEWCCLRASDVGAPHRRERVFIVAADAGRIGRSGWGGAGDVARAARAGEGEGDQRQRHGDATDDRCATAADPDRGGLEVSSEPHSRSFGPGQRPSRRGDTDRRGAADAHTHDERRERSGGERRGIAGSADSGVLAANVGGSGLEGAWVEHAEPLSRVGCERPAGGDLAAADAAGAGRRSHQGCGPRTVQGEQEPERSALEPGRRHSGDRDWGPFEPAIRRWESVLGRPAPTPVDERGRLAPPFVEWMMGYPAGWVTGDVHGRVKRIAQLRMLGNAVVPQQGAAALALTLDAWEAAA